MITSFSRTIISSVIGLRMLSRAVRPMISCDKRDIHLVAAADAGLGDPLQGPAVPLDDDHVLRHVDELSRQVAGVGRLEGRIGQTLAGPVGRAEVLQNASGPRGSST